eukprot:jgi/Chlat1/7208/Chrsp57S06764
MNNRYFLVRHGESYLSREYAPGADVPGIILSNPAFKYDFTWGLTQKGRRQMFAAAQRIEALDFSNGWIYTSNFQRAFQSAAILRSSLGMLFANVRTEFAGLLDPRKMGVLDRQCVRAREGVWEQDQLDYGVAPPPAPDSMQPQGSTESVQDIHRRALETFTRLERTYYGTDIILVSHTDVLEVFQATLLGTDLGNHHADYAFVDGEVRCITI